MLEIYCRYCKGHIYDMHEKPNGEVSSDSFKPANKNIEQPRSGMLMLCPLCDKFFIYEGYNLLTQHGIVNPMDNELWR